MLTDTANPTTPVAALPAAPQLPPVPPAVSPREVEIAAFVAGLAALDAQVIYPMGPGKIIHFTASDLAELAGFGSQDVVERSYSWARYFNHPDCERRLETVREVARFCATCHRDASAWDDVEIFGARAGHQEELAEAMGVGRG